MPHIHTKPGEIDHTASAFIIRTDIGENRLLLHFHKKLHKYMQFGGHIETIETPWEAVKHEILEESGYEMTQLKILQPKQRLDVLDGVVLHPTPIYQITGDFNDIHKHTDIAYAFITTQAPMNAVATDESQDIISLTREELLVLPEDKIFDSVRQAGLFIFDVCLPQWEIVDTSVFQ